MSTLLRGVGAAALFYLGIVGELSVARSDYIPNSGHPVAAVGGAWAAKISLAAFSAACIVFAIKLLPRSRRK